MTKYRSIVIDEENNEVLEAKIKARTIEFSSKIDALEVTDVNGKITGLVYPNELKIEIDKLLTIDKQSYKIQKIKRKDKDCKSYTLYMHELTKSSMFIMPFLGYDRTYFKWDINFCNCYIGLEEDGTYGNNIYLLYRFSGEQWFADFEESLRLDSHFVCAIDVDKSHVMFEFNIPKEHKKDVELILQGKYSEISVGGKNRILTFHNSGDGKPLYQILQKSETRRKLLERDLGAPIPKGQELFDIFVEHNEIYLNKFKIDEQNKIGEEF